MRCADWLMAAIRRDGKYVVVMFRLDSKFCASAEDEHLEGARKKAKLKLLEAFKEARSGQA